MKLLAKLKNPYNFILFLIIVIIAYGIGKGILPESKESEAKEIKVGKSKNMEWFLSKKAPTAEALLDFMDSINQGEQTVSEYAEDVQKEYGEDIAWLFTNGFVFSEDITDEDKEILALNARSLHDSPKSISHNKDSVSYSFHKRAMRIHKLGRWDDQYDFISDQEGFTAVNGVFIGYPAAIGQWETKSPSDYESGNYKYWDYKYVGDHDELILNLYFDTYINEDMTFAEYRYAVNDLPIYVNEKKAKPGFQLVKDSGYDRARTYDDKEDRHPALGALAPEYSSIEDKDVKKRKVYQGTILRVQHQIPLTPSELDLLHMDMQQLLAGKDYHSMEKGVFDGQFEVVAGDATWTLGKNYEGHSLEYVRDWSKQ